jgi:lipoprotein NlpD
MFVFWRRAIVWTTVAGSVFLLAGCGSQSLSRAPVEDRNSPRTAGAMDQAVKQAPGFENAGKPGYYTVKPGETLIRIGLETGQNWKDIARWNNLDRPNQIEVGQVLRVQPPVAAASSSSSSPSGVAVAAPTGVITRPVTSSGVAASSALPPAKPSASEGVAAGDDQLAWSWPVNGPILAGFDEVKNKGLDLGGSAGDAVLAAADGRVVYVGAGLRGYGNLIILKHNSTYLTAYAHNQSLLVKEDQSVRKGQKIAEMGSSDADRVKLHFEVRRQGKPVDPAKFLPNR